MKMRSKVLQRILDKTPKDVEIFVDKYADLVLRINQILREKGYTQKSLAEKLDKRPSEIHKWLNGDHNFTMPSIAKLEIDLDNPETYKHLPNTVKELDSLMFQEIGYYYCYVKFWHKDIFDKDKSGQKKRVKKLIKKFTENRRANDNNISWFREQVYIIQDEIENMC